MESDPPGCESLVPNLVVEKWFVNCFLCDPRCLPSQERKVLSLRLDSWYTNWLAGHAGTGRSP